MKTRPVPEQPYPYRRLYRDPENRVVAGVAAGLAEHLGVRTLFVRVVFVLLIGANGLGPLLYVAFWAVLPAAARVPGRRRRVGLLQWVGLAALTAGVITLRASVSGFGTDSTLVG